MGRKSIRKIGCGVAKTYLTFALASVRPTAAVSQDWRSVLTIDLVLSVLYSTYLTRSGNRPKSDSLIRQR